MCVLGFVGALNLVFERCGESNAWSNRDLDAPSGYQGMVATEGGANILSCNLTFARHVASVDAINGVV